MDLDESEIGSQWSREQDKAFENALATYNDDDDSNKWEKIAAVVQGKTVQEIRQHYELLLDDVSHIESGGVPVPSYSDSLLDASTAFITSEDGITGGGKKRSCFGDLSIECSDGGKGARSDPERRRGIPWTEDEHRLFLLGLDQFGKGDWRSISRNFVITRTPTQVASHAQKYFGRLNSSNNKDRRRSSIHDITHVGTVNILVPGSITGQSIGTHHVGLPPIVPVGHTGNDFCPQHMR